MSTETNPFAALSVAIRHTVETAAQFTVLVDARKRLPGSGIVYSPNLIFTADHIIEREEDINVQLASGQVISASVAGRDPLRDIALLKVSENLPFTASLAVQTAGVGQLVVALGRPDPNGIQASLGIVNAIGGPVRIGHRGVLEQYLRTDTFPYPGFSGGPLVDADGQLLGLNTSSLTADGLITIPAPLLKTAADSLSSYGRIRRGYLGIRSQVVRLNEDQRNTLGRAQATGLLLVSVEEDSPAGQGGLFVSDILVGIAGQAVDTADELQAQLSQLKIGQSTPVQVLRGGQVASLDVIIGEQVEHKRN
ncbi:MAG: PDZ domain-containing protein [Chloroflexi bacterium]|nr:PDZ domain-containing protein [Chloroflexota bacterium]